MTLPVTIVLARVLAPSGLGEYQTLNRTMLVAVGVGVLGYPHAIAWAAARTNAEGALHKLRRMTLVASTIGSIVAVVMFCAIYIAVVGERDWGLFVLFAAVAALSVFNANLNNYFRGRLDVASLMITRLGQAMVWLACIVGLAALGALSVATASATLLSTMAVAVLAGALIMRRETATRKDFGTSNLPEAQSEQTSFSQLSRFAARVFPGLAIREWSVNADQIAVALLLTVHDVGLYAVAASIALALGLFTGPLTNTIQPVIQRASTLAEARVAAAKYFAATTWVVGLPVIAIASTAHWIVPLFYGAAYRESVPVLILLLCGALVSAFNASSQGILLGLGRPGTASVMIATGFAASVILWILLARSLGLTGIATGVVLGGCISLAMQYTRVCRRLEMSAWDLLGQTASSTIPVAIAILGAFRRELFSRKSANRGGPSAV